MTSRIIYNSVTQCVQDKLRQSKISDLKKPQQEDAHLVPQYAEGNFLLFSKGSFPSLDERKDARSSRRSDRYPPGLGNTRGQLIEQLNSGKPKITYSLSPHLQPYH